MSHEPLTLFTFGYEGWGSATNQLIEAVDAVEAARGFGAPMFIDIRSSRSVRAPGFIGSAFEKTVGSARYRWMESLGNVNAKTGGPIQIKDPAAAATLLETAEMAAIEGRRVLFFCHCPEPGNEGQEGACHRATVANLVLDVARRRRLTVRIVEWPGGEPRLANFEVPVSSASFDKIYSGAKTIPLGQPFSLAELAAVPWFSLVNIRDKENGDVYGPLVTGPIQYKFKSKSEAGAWCLLNRGRLDEPKEEIPEFIRREREGLGYQARLSLEVEG